MATCISLLYFFRCQGFGCPCVTIVWFVLWKSVRFYYFCNIYQQQCVWNACSSFACEQLMQIWLKDLMERHVCIVSFSSFFSCLFFQAGMVTNPTIRLVLSAFQSFLSLTTVTVTLVWVFSVSFFSFERLEKINNLFTSLGLVHIVKNCDLRLAALGSIFKTSVTVFHYTDLPANK